MQTITLSISQSDIVTVLIIVVVFFSILLILGIRKSYKLKKENERLDKISEEMAKAEEEYKDFTDGHMYGGN
ncbi:FtsL-like putative cell division protein [Mariniflexile sp. HNIBRBA6329]|uniref:FtsL-like putative cell division protein n=1 Tax=Mariniflexile sp. HNIBRBA6329 TaxID=3373088 RepID=UPI00374876E8